MVGSPYLIPGLLMGLILCSFKLYYQAIIFMILAVYCASDHTFLQAVVTTFLWVVFSWFINGLRDSIR